VVKVVKVLWAPWRMSYIRSIGKVRKCIFCDLRPEDDEENLVIYRGKHCFIIMNKYPYNTAHVMVAPYRHVPTLYMLNNDELMELMKLINLAIKAIENEYRPDGFNIGVNLGKIAGAGVESHVHVHIVPRWVGDTNFMPVIGRIKVIPEDLRITYKRLKNSIKKVLSK